MSSGETLPAPTSVPAGNEGAEANAELLQQRAVARQLGHARRFVHGNYYVLNKNHSSLYIFRGSSDLRMQIFRVVDSLAFGRVIGFFIVANVVATVIDTPGWRDLPQAAETLDALDVVFQIVFTLEMLAKIVALGFAAHRHSYIRSLQNNLDLFLVIVGFVQFFTLPRLFTQLMRLVRCLRAFIYLTKFPLLRSVFVALVEAAAPLRDVMMLMLFIILSMAVLGLQLFISSMHYRCYLNTPTYDANGTTIPNRTTWTIDPLYVNVPCSNSPSAGFQCPTPFSVCDRHDDVFYFDFRNFDYIWTSVYAVFKFVTLDNWPSDVQYIQYANGSAYFLFALIIVLFGSYFTLNLVLAVLSGTFETVTDEIAAKKRREADVKREVNMESDIVLGSSFLTTSGGSSESRTSDQDAVASLDAYFELRSLEGIDEVLSASSESQKSSSEEVSDHNCVWWLRRFMWGSVVRTVAFQRMALIVTFINIIVLATDHQGIEPTWDDVNGWINFGCTVFFFFEAAAKIVAMGTYYFRDPFNDFDFALCLISVIELSLSGPNGGSSATALRAFRLARVMRVINKSKRVRQLLITVATAGYEAALLFVFLIMYMIAGAIFATLVFPEAVDSSQRPNFSNFLNSLLSTFIIISGENWNDTMSAVMRGYSPWMMAFYIPYYIFATYITINFVVVVLIKTFNTAAEAVLLEEDAAIAERMDHDTLTVKATSGTWNPLNVGPPADCQEEGQSPLVPQLDDELQMDDSDDGLFVPVAAVSSLRQSAKLIVDSMEMDGGEAMSSETSPPPPKQVRFTVPVQDQVEQSPSSSSDDPAAGKSKRSVAVLAMKLRAPYYFSFVAHVADFFGMPRDPNEAFSRVEGRSFKIFSATNPIRRVCVLVVSHPMFELLAMLIIVLGCIGIAIDTSTKTYNDDTAKFILAMSYLTAIFFAWELVMKLIAFGVVIGEHAYFRFPSNVLDAVVLLLAILSLFLPLRWSQALRVFRLGSRWKSLRSILETLLAAIPAIANIVMLVTFFYFVAGSFCVQVFKGQFAYCTDSTITSSANCTGFYNTTSTTYDYINSTFVAREVTSASQRYWLFAFFNFNHLGEAFLSMVFVMFSDGWTQLLYSVMDANSDTQAMSYDNNWYWAFLVCYLFLQNNYFLNNLFVGSLMDSFSAERAIATGKTDADGHPLLTDAQERWIREYRFASVAALPQVVPPPRFAIRRFCCWLYFSDDSRADARPSFDFFITVCILINVVFMMSQFDGQPVYWTRFLYGVNVGFACVFAMEFLIKIIAMTPVPYFSVGWNAFDFLLLASAFLSIFLDGPGTNAVRVFRVARVLRLVRRAKGLYRLFESLVYALPQLFNVVVLMILVLFVFGVIGVTLFENVYHDTMSNNTLNAYFSFDSLPNAIMLLFQISTTESWGSVLQACAIKPENSPCTYDAGNCGSAWAFPFFLSFMLIGNSVCVNLLIMIVVDNFEEVGQISSKLSQFLIFRLEHFRQKWVFLDPERTEQLPWRTLVTLLKQMQLSYDEDFRTFESDVWMDDDDDNARDENADLLEPPSDDEAELEELDGSTAMTATAEDFNSPDVMRILGEALGVPGFEKDDLFERSRKHCQLPLDVLNDAYYIKRIAAMSIPVSDGGMVLYQDCVMGFTKEFHEADDNEVSTIGGDFLRSLVDYDRRVVFKLHHAMACVKLQKAFARLVAKRRALREGAALAAAEKTITPVIAMEQGDMQ